MYYLIGLSEYPISGNTSFYLLNSKDMKIQTVNWSKLYNTMRNSVSAVSNAELKYDRVDGQLSVDIVLKSGSISSLPIIQNGVCVRNKNFYVLCRYVADRNKTVGYLILNYIGQPKRVSVKDLEKIDDTVKFINVKLLSSTAGKYFASIRGNLPVVQLKMNGEDIKTKAGQKRVSPQLVSKMDTNKRSKEVMISGHSHTVHSVGVTIENGLFLIKNGTILLGLSKLGTELVYNGSLSKIVIPDGITRIEAEAFKGVSGITSIDMCNSVKEIGDRAFYRCRDLRSIKFSDSVQCISEYCCYECAELEMVSLPFSLNEIKSYAFSGCNKLCGDYPLYLSTVESIGESAFSHCKSLYKVILAPTLKYIGKGAFNYCLKLREVDCTKEVSTILSDSMFTGCEVKILYNKS